MTAVDAPGLSYSSAPGRWVLAVSVLGSGIAALDVTVVNIALPTIGREFRVGVPALAGSTGSAYLHPDAGTATLPYRAVPALRPRCASTDS